MSEGAAVRAGRLRTPQRPGWRGRYRDGGERAARPDPDGSEPAGDRRLGGDAAAEGRPGDARRSDHRAQRARNGPATARRRSPPAATISTPSRSNSTACWPRSSRPSSRREAGRAHEPVRSNGRRPPTGSISFPTPIPAANFPVTGSRGSLPRHFGGRPVQDPADRWREPGFARGRRLVTGGTEPRLDRGFVVGRHLGTVTAQLLETRADRRKIVSSARTGHVSSLPDIEMRSRYILLTIASSTGSSVTNVSFTKLHIP